MSDEQFTVQSHAGPYEVTLEPGAIARIAGAAPVKAHFLIDARVARLYAAELADVLGARPVLLIEATERNKSLDRFPEYVEHLVAASVRRGHVLVAIGGGIIQDIACFLAATLLRGLDWWFYPTTLLAQADSCIGSKSSINVGRIKNILGTFTPPRRVVIDPGLLRTLDDRDVRSGYGEMLKVHAIAGPEAFDEIARDYARLGDSAVLQRYMRRSLEFKRVLIERDEFDRGPRNVMNYGHTFGHAIESATEFNVPHGIAVTIGLDLANHVAVALGQTSQAHFDRMHPTLAANYAGFERVPVPFEPFMEAIAKDKKNTDAQLTLILPDEHARIGIRSCPNDGRVRTSCLEYFTHVR